MTARRKTIARLALRLYRLHLHFDPVLVRRWKWKKHLAGNRLLLEVGPGGGPWTLELLRRKNKVTVVDVDVSSLLRLKSKVERFALDPRAVRLVNARAADFAAREKYDQIVLFEVLEHITDDRGTVANLARHLAPGGEMLISAPHRGHIPISGECVSPREDGRHVRKGYSPGDLENLLSESGLTITRQETACGWFTRNLTDLANRIYRLTRSRLLYRIFLIVVRPLVRLDFLRPGYPPYTCFVIAARPGPGQSSP